MLNIIDSLDSIHGYSKKYQVHGNIKPSNIFFSTSDINNQTVAIGDVFHCQIFTDTFPISNCSSIELLESNDCTTSSDIWSVGCVLYFICTGQYPFPKKVGVDYIKEGKHGELLKTGQFECFNGLYENMITVDKKKRYATKKIRDILNGISNDGSSSVPVGPSASPRKKAPPAAEVPKGVNPSVPLHPPPAPSAASQNQHSIPIPSPTTPNTPPVKRTAKEISRGYDDEDNEHILLKKRNIAKEMQNAAKQPAMSFKPDANIVNSINIYYVIINFYITHLALNSLTSQVNNNLDVVTSNKLLKFVFDNYASVRHLLDNYSGQLCYVVLKAVEGEGCLRFERIYNNNKYYI